MARVSLFFMPQPPPNLPPSDPMRDPVLDDAAAERALTDYYKASLLHALKYLGTADSKEQYDIWKDHFSLSAITRHGIPKRMLEHGELTRARLDEFTECLWRQKQLPEWLKSMLDTQAIDPAEWGLEH
jgi:hypothetical protein